MLFINAVKYFLFKINLRALAVLLLRQLVFCFSPGSVVVIRGHSWENLWLKHHCDILCEKLDLSPIITNQTMLLFPSLICLWSCTIKQITTFTTLHSNCNFFVSCCTCIR